MHNQLYIHEYKSNRGTHNSNNNKKKKQMHEHNCESISERPTAENEAHLSRQKEATSDATNH